MKALALAAPGTALIANTMKISKQSKRKRKRMNYGILEESSDWDTYSDDLEVGR